MLRLLYNDSESTFNELLAIDNTFTIHEVNMQKLMTEMFKDKNQIRPSLLQTYLKTILKSQIYKPKSMVKNHWSILEL